MPLLRRATVHSAKLPSISASFSICRDSIESALLICDAQHNDDNDSDGSIDAIFLGGNHISDRGIARIVDGLDDYIQYRKLYLSYNRISQYGVNLISQSLRCNKTLIELSLGDNAMGNEGARLLASSLKENDTLEILNLEKNGIGCEGTKAIVDAMLHNTVLQYLVLSENPIEDDGAKALRRCIKDTSSLLNLHRCNHTLLSIYLKKVTLVKDGRILRDIKRYLKVNRMSNNSPQIAATRKILMCVREKPWILTDYIIRTREDNPGLEMAIMPKILSLLASEPDLATMNIIMQTSPGIFLSRANSRSSEQICTAHDTESGSEDTASPSRKEGKPVSQK